MAKNKKLNKIFVLDTSVILHDHNSLNCFEENDVAIPITVLEELDNFKRVWPDDVECNKDVLKSLNKRKIIDIDEGFQSKFQL